MESISSNDSGEKTADGIFPEKLKSQTLDSVFGYHKEVHRNVEELLEKRKELIYENYSKFTGVIDIIKSANEQFPKIHESLEESKNTLFSAMTINADLQGATLAFRKQASDIANKYASMSEMKLLFEFPDRLQRLIKEKNYYVAIAEHSAMMPKFSERVTTITSLMTVKDKADTLIFTELKATLLSEVESHLKLNLFKEVSNENILVECINCLFLLDVPLDSLYSCFMKSILSDSHEYLYQSLLNNQILPSLKELGFSSNHDMYARLSECFSIIKTNYLSEVVNDIKLIEYLFSIDSKSLDLLLHKKNGSNAQLTGLKETMYHYQEMARQASEKNVLESIKAIFSCITWREYEIWKAFELVHDILLDGLNKEAYVTFMEDFLIVFAKDVFIWAKGFIQDSCFKGDDDLFPKDQEQLKLGLKLWFNAIQGAADMIVARFKFLFNKNSYLSESFVRKIVALLFSEFDHLMNFILSLVEIKTTQTLRASHQNKELLFAYGQGVFEISRSIVPQLFQDEFIQYIGFQESGNQFSLKIEQAAKRILVKGVYETVIEFVEMLQVKTKTKDSLLLGAERFKERLENFQQFLSGIIGDGGHLEDLLTNRRQSISWHQLSGEMGNDRVENHRQQTIIDQLQEKIVFSADVVFSLTISSTIIEWYAAVKKLKFTSMEFREFQEFVERIKRIIISATSLDANILHGFSDIISAAYLNTENPQPLDQETLLKLL